MQLRRRCAANVVQICCERGLFLGSLTKLRKATLCVIMFCRPSVRMDTTRLPLDGFLWNLIFEYFRKAVEFRVSLKSDNNNGALHEDRYTCTIFRCDSFYNKKWMRLHSLRTTDRLHTGQDRWIQKELAFIPAKNATKPNPFKILPLQLTRKENNWETEEMIGRATLTLETERAKWPNPGCLR
jgi:hypothetical protein